MNRRVSSLVMVLGAMSLLAACGPGGSATTTASPAPASHLVSPGSSPTRSPAAGVSEPTTGTPSGTMPTASPPQQTSVGRTGHTATLLRDGRVLIVGGQGGTTIFASAELYDPKTGKFTATGSMTTARTDHTATLLSDGRVLIAGGYNATGGLLNSAELYDPKTGEFSSTKPMTTARFHQVATLLPNGRVLLVGGVNSAPATAWAEIYDPATGKFSATGSMVATEYVVTATLLANGSVLVTGSLFDMAVPTYRPSAEIYQPTSGTFKLAGSMSALRFDGATATLLSNGQVLIVGGSDEAGFSAASAELYEPKENLFRSLGPIPPRTDHTATLLADGRVLIAGGDGVTIQSGGFFNASAEIYDPRTETFSSTGSMEISRARQTATLLPDGHILLAGGVDDIGGIGTLDPASTSDLSSLPLVELYDPTTGTFSPTASLTDAP